MVIVRLMGGLGNQFFQYAAGRALAHRHHVPLKVHLSRFERYPLRKYALDHFNISASIADPSEVARITGTDRNRVYQRVSDFLQRRLPYYRRTVLMEQHFHFDPNIGKAPNQVYIVGYWQSEKYFKEIEPILRKELKVKSAPDPVNEAISHRIRQVESVSLHIRRGDYVSNPNTLRYHGGCSLEYYGVAVQSISQMIHQPHFFIFSDDIAWAEHNLHLDYPVTFVTHNGEEKNYEDLRLLSHCKHHILANSTFSWWGAWLSAHPEKIVIAPKKWFNTLDLDTKDLLPESWIKI